MSFIFVEEMCSHNEMGVDTLSFRILVFLCSLGHAVVYCTPTTLTSCPLNHYAILSNNGNSILGCQPCNSCPPGYGVERNCTATQNTVCALCDIGLYSSTMSMLDGCTPCKRCPPNGQLGECTPISDAVCKRVCQHGFYYDPSTDECTQCSNCFPDRPFARTVRVEDCRLQQMPTDYQCTPLPSPDAADSWSPPFVVVAPNRRRLNPDRRGSDVQIEMGNAGEESSNLRLTDAITPVIDLDATKGIHGYGHRDSDQDLRMTQDGEEGRPDGHAPTRSSFKTLRERNSSNASEESTGSKWDQQAILAQPRSLNSTDITLVVIIALSCGLMLIVTTTIACHCWMKRGKHVRAKVSTVNGGNPKWAWRFVDVMPPEPEHIHLMETPPQTRKITCV